MFHSFPQFEIGVTEIGSLQATTYSTVHSLYDICLRMIMNNIDGRY